MKETLYYGIYPVVSVTESGDETTVSYTRDIPKYNSDGLVDGVKVWTFSETIKTILFNQIIKKEPSDYALVDIPLVTKDLKDLVNKWWLNQQQFNYLYRQIAEEMTAEFGIALHAKMESRSADTIPFYKACDIANEYRSRFKE